MANEKKPAVKPVETVDSNKETSVTQVVVDQIETPAEMALKDKATAEKIINRVVIMEGDIKSVEMAINLKKVYVGCLLLITKRLANSSETDINTEAEVSLFDKMIEAKMVSRATAYRRIGDAHACIEANLISHDMLAQIEKSEVASPDLISLLDKKLSTPKGVKIQQSRGLLPAPDKAKVKLPVEKQMRGLLRQLKNRVKQVTELVKTFEGVKTDAALLAVVKESGTNWVENLDKLMLDLRNSLDQIQIASIVEHSEPELSHDVIQQQNSKTEAEVPAEAQV